LAAKSLIASPDPKSLNSILDSIDYFLFYNSYGYNEKASLGMVNFLKIGIICDHIDYGAAGIGRYIHELLNSLLELDKTNEYVLIHKDVTKDLLYDSGTTEKIFPLEHNRILPLGLLFRARLINRWAEKNLTILHQPANLFPFQSSGKLRNIVTVHDIVPLLFHSSLHTHYSYLTWRAVFPMTLEKSHKIIVPSEHTRNDILSRFSVDQNKISVIYNAASNKYKPIECSDMEKQKILKKYMLPDSFILTVSTIEPRKNLIRLIQAYNLIKDDIRQRLVIVGAKGWMYSNIFKLVKELNCEKDVIFAGYIEENDLSLIYNLSKLFIFPSLYEGFGLPILEAMKCGIPVAVSRISSLPEVAGNAAIYFDPYDINDIANSIMNILTDEKVQNSMRTEGLLQAAKFDWKRNAEKTLEIYKITAEDLH